MRMVAWVIFLAIAAGYILLSITARRKYKLLLEGKSNPLLPAGLRFIEISRWNLTSSYSRRIEYKFKHLGFHDRSKNMLRIHMASKFALVSASAALLCLIAAVSAQTDPAFAVFALGTPIILAFAQDKQLDGSIRKRKKLIEAEFPIFLNKLVLLTGAGLNITPAITKITADDRSDSYLYQELKKVLYDMETGRSFTESFECFSRSCGISEVNTFVSTLIQHTRKGNDDLIPILRLLSESCWERRHNAARKSGEEMSTRLLLPTMLIFIAILILLMTPAFIQMSAV